MSRINDDRAALAALMESDPAVSQMAEAGMKQPVRKSAPQQQPPLELHTSQAKDILPPPQKTVKKLEFYSAASLYGAQLKRPPIIINNLVPAGLTVLAGAPKRGKSWMALKMALDVSSGTPFFGMQTRKGDVLYLDLESRQYRVQDRLSKLLAGPAPENLYISHNSDRLDGDLLEQLKGWTQAVKNPSLIIIDTLGRVKGGTRRGENAYESDTRILGKLQEFALENKLAVICVHHLRKDTGDNTDYFERVSGSMGITGACDAVMVLAGKRGEETCVLRTSSRDFEATDFVVRFNGGAWQLESSNSEAYQAEQAYIHSPVVRSVIALMHQSPQWQGTASDLMVSLSSVSDDPMITMRSSELGKELQRFAEELKERDNIRITMRRSGKRGQRVLTINKIDVLDQPTLFDAPENTQPND